MAPEMILGDYYDSKVDIWSLGVLLYNIVSGHMPFPAETQETLFAKIALGKFDFQHEEFNLVSSECKDLVKKMLVKDPKRRLSAVQVLQHPWFSKFAEDQVVSDEVDRLDAACIQKLRDYKAGSYFKRAAMNILVKLTQPEELTRLTKQFQELDIDKTGMITATELKEFIAKHHMDVDDKEISRMIRDLDYAGNGRINYSEFLAATVDVQTFFNEQKLRVVFSMFDTFGTGQITAEEMHFAFQKLGQQVPLTEVQALVQEHDSAKDGYISFDEFKDIFKKKQ
jgi:calcium-dependent protein kinase